MSPPKLYGHQCLRPLSVHIWWFATDFASEVVFSCVASPLIKLPVVFFCSIAPTVCNYFFFFFKKKPLTLVIFIVIPLFTNIFLKLWLCCTTSSYIVVFQSSWLVIWSIMHPNNNLWQYNQRHSIPQWEWKHAERLRWA